MKKNIGWQWIEDLLWLPQHTQCPNIIINSLYIQVYTYIHVHVHVYLDAYVYIHVSYSLSSKSSITRSWVGMLDTRTFMCCVQSKPGNWQTCIYTCTCVCNITCMSPSQAVDVSKERIYLDTSESTMSADDLPTVVPDGFPRYHFFLFKHSFEGDYQESVGKQLHSLIVYVSSVLRVGDVGVHTLGITGKNSHKHGLQRALSSVESVRICTVSTPCMHNQARLPHYMYIYMSESLLGVLHARYVCT